MSELKQYLDKVSWTESVSQHKEAIIFIHDRQIKNLERQLEEANDKNKWIKKQQESWNSTTKGTIKDLERKLADAREVQNKLGEWVSHYIHCIRTVEYCGSLEDALEMDQYMKQLKEKVDE